jgi:glycosyltransferase involved in cell wall biosynthesis
MKVSVIIPAYNAAHWLPAAVASVRAQTRPADEIVIVDDGSTDQTAEVGRSLGPDIRCVRRENGGLSAARNTGTDATTGEWMLFLDADDRLVPDALASLTRTAAGSDAGVVYGFVLQRRAKGEEPALHGLKRAVGNPPVPAKAHFWWTAIPTAGAALIRRSLNEKVGGFDENFRQVEDAEYWLRCGVTAPFAHCDSLVLDKTYTPTSLGQQRAASIWYRLQLQRKFLLWCACNAIDTSFLDVRPSDLITHALKQIHYEKAWPILDQVLGQAREMGVRPPWYWRSLVTARALGLVARHPSSNLPIVHARWLENHGRVPSGR